MSDKKVIYKNAQTVVSLLPAVRTTGAATGSAVQWGDCMSVMAIITAGTLTDGSHVVEIQHSDDNVTYTAVPDAQLLGTEPTLTSSVDDRSVDIGYIGTKPYLRGIVTSATATTGGVIGVSFLKAHPYQGPVR